MAVSSLLVLIDDITVLLDDVALMTKVAAKKTAGVLGDDLALLGELDGIAHQIEQHLAQLALVGHQGVHLCRPSASCLSSGRWPRVPCATR